MKKGVIKMNENVNKPITVIRAEFISKLTTLINESMLPFFIVEPILKEFYLEVKEGAQKQYELDVRKYEQAQYEQLNTEAVQIVDEASEIETEKEAE